MYVVHFHIYHKNLHSIYVLEITDIRLIIY